MTSTDAKRRYLAMAQDDLRIGPKNETMAQHRKHCKAEKQCPFEKKADKVDDIKKSSTGHCTSRPIEVRPEEDDFAWSEAALNRHPPVPECETQPSVSKDASIVKRRINDFLNGDFKKELSFKSVNSTIDSIAKILGMSKSGGVSRYVSYELPIGKSIVRLSNHPAIGRLFFRNGQAENYFSIILDDKNNSWENDQKAKEELHNAPSPIEYKESEISVDGSDRKELFNKANNIVIAIRNLIEDGAMQIPGEESPKTIPKSPMAFNYQTVPVENSRQQMAQIKAQVRAQKVLDEIGGTVLGSSMAREFKDNGTASIIGQKAASAGDLAAAAQIYSNPSFETFRWFLIKDGKVAYQTGVTSRLPNHTSLFARGYTANAIRAAIRRLWPIDGVYALHNHPSGSVTFSKPDRNNTEYAGKTFEQQFGARFLGQIIIDHDKYSFHRPNETPEENIAIRNPSESSSTPEMDSQLLGMKASNASDIARIATRMQKICEHGKDDAQIIVRKLSYVSGIASCKLSALMSMDVEKIGDLMRRYVIASTGNDVSIVYSHSSSNRQYDDKLAECIMKNVFLDAVYKNAKKGSPKGLRHERSLDPDYHAYECGIELNKGRTPTYIVEPN